MLAIDPNIKLNDRNIDGLCVSEVQNTDDIMNMLLATHVFAFVTCFYREIFSSNVKSSGFMMRALEVISLAVMMNSIFYTIFEISTWWLLGFENFPEVINILDNGANMLGYRVT